MPTLLVRVLAGLVETEVEDLEEAASAAELVARHPDAIGLIAHEFGHIPKAQALELDVAVPPVLIPILPMAKPATVGDVQMETLPISGAATP